MKNKEREALDLLADALIDHPKVEGNDSIPKNEFDTDYARANTYFLEEEDGSYVLGKPGKVHKAGHGFKVMVLDRPFTMHSKDGITSKYIDEILIAEPVNRGEVNGLSNRDSWLISERDSRNAYRAQARQGLGSGFNAKTNMRIELIGSGIYDFKIGKKGNKQ